MLKRMTNMPPTTFAGGEHLVADVYDTLRANEDLWNKTAYIVTYDEHGGFFDHVAPPATISPDGIDSPRPDDNFHHGPPPPFKFDRLGIRVPALIASPWVATPPSAQPYINDAPVSRSGKMTFTTASGPLPAGIAVHPQRGSNGVHLEMRYQAGL
jgi:hypothetical protein